MEYVTPRNVTNGDTARNDVFYVVRFDNYVFQQQELQEKVFSEIWRRSGLRLFS
jgi:hypothetical protein